MIAKIWSKKRTKTGLILNPALKSVFLKAPRFENFLYTNNVSLFESYVQQQIRKFVVKILLNFARPKKKVFYNEKKWNEIVEKKQISKYLARKVKTLVNPKKGQYCHIKKRINLPTCFSRKSHLFLNLCFKKNDNDHFFIQDFEISL